MKKNWQTKKLGEVCKFDKVQGVHGELPYIGLEHIESHTARFIGSTKTQIVKSATFKFSKEHVLYGRLRPYLNKVFVPDFIGHCSTEIFPIKPSSQLSREYLKYWFLADSTVERINATCTGARMPRANMKQVLEFDFPVPPFDEQRRIVGILDEAFAGIATAFANSERNLQNARAIFQSHLHATFANPHPDWVENKLQTLTTKTGSGATPRGGKESYKTKGVSLIRSLNVHDAKFRYVKLAFLDDAQAANLLNVVVESQDVLLNITGASVARCCIVPENVLPARVNQHVSIIRPIAEKLNPEFLHYLLVSKPYKKLLLQTGEEGGSTRQAITKAQIQNFRITYPKSLKEQQIIVKKLDALSAETQRLTAIYEQKCAALEALKKSLLHRAFSGAL